MVKRKKNVKKKPARSAAPPEDLTGDFIALHPAANEPMPAVLPVLPLVDLVLFPGMIVPLIINNARSVKMIDDTATGSRFFLANLIRNRAAPDDKVSWADVHGAGCVGRLIKMLKFPDETIRVLVQGVARAVMTEPASDNPYITSRYETLSDAVEESIELAAVARNASQAFQEIITLSPTLPDELKIAVINTEEPGRLADLIAANLNMGLEERQKLVEEVSPKGRLTRLLPLLTREREVLRIGLEIQTQVTQSITQNQREHFLREQMNAIRKELGDQDRTQADLEEKINAAGMPPEVVKVANKEKERLGNIPAISPEHGVIRTYLELLADLPWNKTTEDHMDIAAARRILDEEHYDLVKIKERILEYLSVLKLKKNMKGPILCFTGPPGVGKTSLGQSIAHALGRKFIRMSLGGMRDEAEIRGHRRTYIGAMPGRIIQNIRKAGTRNPVFMLDEIDKVGMDFRGDPASALLEVLDPEQNHTFTDHYLDVPFDLSSVLFIATANILDTIPLPLRDRMEIIELPGYTQEEKIQIALRHLVKHQVAEHGLTPRQIHLPRAALARIISDYTREAGVRNLDREIANICRKAARQIVEGQTGRITVNADRLKEWLGPTKFDAEVAEKILEPGVATGLAWTPVGGDILFIEATRMAGKGNLILTGSLGDVMKESARAALSYLQANTGRYGMAEALGDKFDLHLHVPAGSIPKDGPSAGLAMTMAMLSLFSGKAVPATLAMTGEITLRGKVMPVGGIKEKVLAAARAGIKRIILPKGNERHFEEIPEEIRKKISFTFVDNVEAAAPFLIAAPRKAGR
ncbi:MAG TPA: endopeptidase La [Kiritimatiellia bacterium]|mgnify:CR=1 FL=1|nr:endopeptidase La [Kiritimatiellia bacterium]HMP00106.1 endopeptidase La [Kiritimatiellia bacterium]HMP96647.1 endopeptidase La [Kiritimatiellia bacterium]